MNEDKREGGKMEKGSERRGRLEIRKDREVLGERDYYCASMAN